MGFPCIFWAKKGRVRGEHCSPFFNLKNAGKTHCFNRVFRKIEILVKITKKQAILRMWSFLKPKQVKKGYLLIS